MRSPWLINLVFLLTANISSTFGGKDHVQQAFALQVVDVEAGIHPARPNRDDQRVRTWDGHAYWLRKTALVSGGLRSIDSYRGRFSGSTVVFILSGEDSDNLKRNCSSVLGRTIAIVIGAKIAYTPVITVCPEHFTKLTIHDPFPPEEKRADLTWWAREADVPLTEHASLAP